MLEIGNRPAEGEDLARLEGEGAFQAKVAQHQKREAVSSGSPSRDAALRAQLHDAIRSGDTGKALALLKAGASPYTGNEPAVRDPAHQTSELIFAAANGDAEVVRAILEPLSPQERAKRINERGPGGNTALHAAVFGRDAETLAYLRAEGGNERLANDAGQPPSEIPPHLQKRFLGLLVAGAALGLAFEAWALGSGQTPERLPLDVADHAGTGWWPPPNPGEPELHYPDVFAPPGYGYSDDVYGSPMEWGGAPGAAGPAGPAAPSSNRDLAQAFAGYLRQALGGLVPPLALEWLPEINYYRVGGQAIMPDPNLPQRQQEDFALSVLESMARNVGYDRNPNLTYDQAMRADQEGRHELATLFNGARAVPIWQGAGNFYDFENRVIYVTGDTTARGPDLQLDPDSAAGRWMAERNTDAGINFNYALSVANRDRARGDHDSVPMVAAVEGRVPQAIHDALFSYEGGHNLYRSANGVPLRQAYSSQAEYDQYSALPEPIGARPSPLLTGSEEAMSRENTTDEKALIRQINVIAGEIGIAANQGAAEGAPIDMTGRLISVKADKSFVYKFSFGDAILLAPAVNASTSVVGRLEILRTTMQSLLVVVQTQAGRIALRNAVARWEASTDSRPINIVAGNTARVQVAAGNASRMALIGIPKPVLDPGQQVTHGSHAAENMMEALAQAGADVEHVRIGWRGNSIHHGVLRSKAAGIGLGPYIYQRGTLNDYLRELAVAGVPVQERHYAINPTEVDRGHWGLVDPEIIRNNVYMHPQDEGYAAAYALTWLSHKAGHRMPTANEAPHDLSGRDLPDPTGHHGPWPTPVVQDAESRLRDRITSGDIGFRELFELRFQESGGRPAWSDELTRTVDEHLKNARPSIEDREALRTGILRFGSKWTRDDLQAVIGSSVTEGEGLGWLKETITALFYEKDFQHLRGEPQYNEALDAVAGYIASSMQGQHRLLPELDETAKRHLATVIKYHFFHFNPQGADRYQSAQAVRYHHGADYLADDIPGIVAERVKDIFGKGGHGAGAVVEDWFSDEGSDANEVMTGLITREHDGYVAYANQQHGGPDSPSLRLWER